MYRQETVGLDAVRLYLPNIGSKVIRRHGLMECLTWTHKLGRRFRCHRITVDTKDHEKNGSDHKAITLRSEETNNNDPKM
jgi:hypothetical protein